MAKSKVLKKVEVLEGIRQMPYLQDFLAYNQERGHWMYIWREKQDDCGNWYTHYGNTAGAIHESEFTHMIVTRGLLDV